MLMPGTMMAGRVLERNNGGLFFDVSLSAFVFAKPALLAMAAAAAAATGLKHAKNFISGVKANQRASERFEFGSKRFSKRLQ